MSSHAPCRGSSSKSRAPGWLDSFTTRGHRAILTGVELDDLKFASVSLLLATSGIVAALLAVTGVVNGVPVAAALVPPSIAMLLAAHELSPSLPRTLRLAGDACVAAAGVWCLVGLSVASEPAAIGGCLAMVASSIGGGRFVHERLAGPWWARTDSRGALRPVGDATGWIEELAVE